jgi:spore maturation protein CgeB
MNKILFIGDLNEYGRSFQRYRALIELGNEVRALSTVPVFLTPEINQPSLIERLFWKLKLPIDSTGVNKKIRQLIEAEKFDIIWIEKGNTIKPKTLFCIKKKLPQAKLISCSEDDMYTWHSRSFYYTFGLFHYDIVFTTKVYNLRELKSLGAKRTELFLDAYDEKVHRPMELSEDDKKRFSCDISFIGSFENDRAEKMLFLAEKGLKVVVWGNGWSSWINKNQNLIIKNTPLYNDDYTKAINATKINLCFLRKLNRDQVTSRSVEIPACGGFMIAERTKRHLEFFEEGKEAVFFNSKEELYQKVKKYLADEEARLKIAKAGRRRCVQSGYDHKTQLSKMLQV